MLLKGARLLRACERTAMRQYREVLAALTRFLAAGVLILVGGCTPKTGLLLEVTGPDNIPAAQIGITKLDFVVAHQSFCDRWVGVPPAMHTVVDVRGRDLVKNPYTLMVEPSHRT